MKLSTAHLDHLIVPPAMQRARHREFHRKMWAPPSLRVVVPEADPEPPSVPLPPPVLDPEPIEPPRTQPMFETPEECLRWMRAEFFRTRFARPYLRPVLIARSVGARAFGTTIRQMMSADRRRPLVTHRMMTMAFANVVCMEGLTTVGRAFRRDHTTAIHAINRFGDIVRRALSEVPSEDRKFGDGLATATRDSLT